MKCLNNVARFLIYGFLTVILLIIATHIAKGQTISGFGTPFQESVSFDILKGGDHSVAYLQITCDPASIQPVFLEISAANISRGLEYKKINAHQTQLAGKVTLITLAQFLKDDLYTLRVSLAYSKRSGKLVAGKDFFIGTRQTSDGIWQFCLADLYNPPAPPLKRESPVPLEDPKPSHQQVMEVEGDDAFYDNTATFYSQRPVYFDQPGFLEYQKRYSIPVSQPEKIATATPRADSVGEKIFLKMIMPLLEGGNMIIVNFSEALANQSFTWSAQDQETLAEFLIPQEEKFTGPALDQVGSSYRTMGVFLILPTPAGYSGKVNLYFKFDSIIWIEQIEIKD